MALNILTWIGWDVGGGANMYRKSPMRAQLNMKERNKIVYKISYNMI